MHDTKNNYNFFGYHSPHASILNRMHLDHLLVPIVFTNLCYHSKHIAYDVFPNQFVQLIANWIPYKNYCLGSNLKHGSQTNPTILVISDQIWSLFSIKKNGNMNLHTFLNLDNKQQKMNSPKFGSWGWLPSSKYYFKFYVIHIKIGIKIIFELHVSRSIDNSIPTILIGPLHVNINKILLLKSLILVKKFQHNLYMFCHTKSMFFQNTNLQQNGREEMLSHFPLKPHLKIKQ
jgi:hypothetical protein